MEKKPQNSESRHADKYIVRFPEGMRDRIKRDADERGRSMNSQIVYMLQSYFEQLDKGVSELQAAMDSGLITSLGSPETNAALVKVLHFRERQILMARVSRLGGTEEVLSANKADLVRKIDGDEITRTANESVSYFSQVVGQAPLTAVLTTEEIDAIAKRMVQIQQAQLHVATKADYSDPQQVFEDAVNGPSSDDPTVRKEQERRKLAQPEEEDKGINPADLIAGIEKSEKPSKK